MALKGFRAFSDEEARFIKENLIRGVTIAAVAAHFGVSIETVSKIKRGLTYTWVRVEGEEKLRPVGWAQGPTAKGPQQAVLRQKTAEEIERLAEESEREMAQKLAAGEFNVEAKTERKEVSNDLKETLRKLGLDL